MKMRKVIGWGVGLVIGLLSVSSVQADGGITTVELPAGMTLIKTCGQHQLAVFDRAVALGEQRSLSDRLEMNPKRLSNEQTIYVYCAQRDNKGAFIFFNGESWQNQASAGFTLAVSYPDGQLKAAFTAIGGK